MGKINIVNITEEEKKSLEKGVRQGKTHSYRTRCQMILLKSKKKSSEEIGKILGCCEVSVNRWMKRYEKYGIEGLSTVKGSGRKHIIKENDVEKVKELISKNGKDISDIKNEIEKLIGKELSMKTLKRFISKNF